MAIGGSISICGGMFGVTAIVHDSVSVSHLKVWCFSVVQNKGIGRHFSMEFSFFAAVYLLVPKTLVSNCLYKRYLTVIAVLFAFILNDLIEII